MSWVKQSICRLWLYGAHVLGFHSLNQSYFNEPIIYGKCPPNYCCQNDKGCDFLFDRQSLCAENRDYNTLLCGKCVYGYSEMTEMYGSSRCEVCTNSTQPSLFLIAIAFGFGLALFTIATKSSALPDTGPGCLNGCKECVIGCWDSCKQKCYKQKCYLILRIIFERQM
eukprot:913567_1